MPDRKAIILLLKERKLLRFLDIKAYFITVRPTLKDERVPSHHRLRFNIIRFAIGSLTRKEKKIWRFSCIITLRQRCNNYVL